MQKLLVANFKMNGNKNFYKKVNKEINKLKSKDTVILCPPFVYMPFFKFKNKNVFLGSQDIAEIDNKKSTGQINAAMLNEFAVNYSIIGHSERRANGESDELIAKKIQYAQKNGIIPIVCIGLKTKTLKVDFLVEQVKSALSLAENKDIIFAYEPNWAIGSGVQPTVKNIDKVIDVIKTTASELGFNATVLYGGSVNASNFEEVSKSKAEGFLMGTVSLKLDELFKIFKGI